MKTTKEKARKGLLALFTWVLLGMFFGIGSAVGVIVVLELYI